MFIWSVVIQSAYRSSGVTCIVSITHSAQGRSKRSVLKLKTKPKNKSEDEIGRFTPYDWSNREKEAQETGWARFWFQVLFNRFCIYSKPKSKNLKTNSPSKPKREPRPWRPSQLRMPRRLDSQTTEQQHQQHQQHHHDHSWGRDHRHYRHQPLLQTTTSMIKLGTLGRAAASGERRFPSPGPSESRGSNRRQPR